MPKTWYGYTNSDSYLKTSGSLFKVYIDKPALSNAGADANFHDASNNALFKF